MVLKYLNLERTTSRSEERISNYSYSLSFETIRFKVLFITTMRNIFGCFPGCLVIVIKANNSIKNIDSFRYALADWPACSIKSTITKNMIKTDKPVLKKSNY